MKKILTVLNVIIFSASSSFAQDYLFQDDLTIVSHKRKSSPITFQTGNIESKISVIGYLFKPGNNDLYKGMDDKVLLYQDLPTCKESKVILDEVFQHSDGSEAIDFIVYDYQNPTQSKNAKDQSRATIPWDPSYDTNAGYLTLDAKMQDLARVMAPECLPTSFRYIYSGSKRYREAKTGDKAWEK